jgi:immune inhibitor A
MVALVVVGVSMSRPCGAVMPTREGTVPEVVSNAFDQGRFDLSSERTLSEGPLRTNLATSTWKVPIIMADFTDQPMTYSNPADWNRALFDTTGSTPTGSVFDYYTWVSGGRIRVIGKVVAFVHLPKPKNDYADSSWGLGTDPTRNSYAAIDQALRLCPNTIDWSEFDRDLDGKVDVVWLLHSGFGGENVVTRKDLWSITSKMTDWPNGYAFDTGTLVPGTQIHEQVDRFSVVPEISGINPGQRCEIGVFCHEFGHTLGLPDLYERGFGGSTRNVGVGNWSLMSTGAYGTDGQSPQFPSHLGAWPMLYLGWATTVRPTEDGPMALAPIENGGKILDLWFQGETSSEHFLVENRQRLGFDRNLPDSGLMIYHLNDAAIQSGLPSNHVINGFTPALRVVEADGRQDLLIGDNHGEASDPFPGSTGDFAWNDQTTPNSRSTLGNVTNVGLSNISAAGDSAHCLVQVRAPGWLAARNASAPGLSPVVGPGRGTRAGRLPDGSVVAVTSENVNGKAQIVLRTRNPVHQWQPPFQVSASPGAATEPSLGVLPGGDLCVVWSDSRDGANELYFRSRVLGVWSSERRLTNLNGYSRSPALATDSRGGVHVAWYYTDAGISYIYFMYFPYLAPGAQARQVSPAGAKPDPPAVASAPDGSSYLVWSDRTVASSSIWYAHFAPDSGARPARRAIETGGILPGVAAAVDPSGVLYMLWQTGGSDGNAIHLQGRDVVTHTDTVLVRRGDSIQDFGINAAPDGGLHIIAEAAVNGSSQILYQEMRPDGAWDVGATEVTRGSDPPATRPMMIPATPGHTTVLYISYAATGGALMERERGDWNPLLTAVPAEPGSRAGLELRIGPNPLVAGAPLHLEGAAGRALEVFDLTGRRVAAVPAATTAEWITIPGSVTRGWNSGVYFVRAGSARARASFVVIH